MPNKRAKKQPKEPDVTLFLMPHITEATEDDFLAMFTAITGRQATEEQKVDLHKEFQKLRKAMEADERAAKAKGKRKLKLKRKPKKYGKDGGKG
jgi:hypothetical protein